jgi:hypothetical protein
MIRFNCPHCAKAISVKPELAGRRGKCPGCAQIIDIPDDRQNTPDVASNTQSSSLSAYPGADSGFQVPSVPYHATPNAFTSVHQVPMHPSLPHASTTEIHAPTTAIQVNVSQSNAAHSLGISSLVLGILSFFLCWIPFLGMPLSGLGLLLGIGGLVMAFVRHGSGIGYSIAGSAVNAMGLALGIVFITAISGALDSADTALNDMSDYQIQPQARPVSPNENAGDLTDSIPSANDGGGVVAAPSNARPNASNQAGHMWTNISTPLQLGSVQVRIKQVTVGKVPLFQPIGDRNTQSQDDVLAIWLEITNTNEKRKIDYSGWMNDFASLQDIDAELTDDNGNRYRQIRFSGLLKVKDTETNTSIYPGRSIQDAVVFEPPIDSATHLHLRLSAKGCGEEGEFRFEIPAGFLSPQLDAQTSQGDANSSGYKNVTRATRPTGQTLLPPEYNEWINESYDSTLRHVRDNEWTEFNNKDGTVRLRYVERGRSEDRVELFCPERNQEIRFLPNRAELRKNGKWEWIANGHWVKPSTTPQSTPTSK